MEFLKLFNRIIFLLFTLCYFYQYLYVPVPWLLGKRRRQAPALPHSFAVLICARNEEAVIGDLLDSIRQQTYDKGPVRVFVMADSCRDRTAEIAAEKGAVVYRRADGGPVGKGYALQELMAHIREDFPAGFDGYLVFDADNLLKPDYIEEMNRTFSEGYGIVTGYRNSKNYGDNWISAGYALWFLRESRYLNHARCLLGTSCAVSGTGFLFSRQVAEEMGPWPYHLLVEDIEFTVDQITKGRRIGFCPAAELFDEQPVRFAQSWRQRLRWSRGYLQVFGRYGGRLLRGIFRGSFACFDMAMNIMPAFALTTLSLVCNLAGVLMSLSAGAAVLTALLPFGRLLLGMYLTLFALGAVTTLTEWKHIRTGAGKKLLYMFTFPLFMFTYIPIALASLFCSCGWKPIEHSVTAEQLRRQGRFPLV